MGVLGTANPQECAGDSPKSTETFLISHSWASATQPAKDLRAEASVEIGSRPQSEKALWLRAGLQGSWAPSRPARH